MFIYNGLVWFSYQTDIRRLQQTVRTAERIICGSLPSLRELYTSRVRKRVKKVTLDTSHPAHSLFELLSSGRRYRAPERPDTRTLSKSHLNNTQHTPVLYICNNSSNLHLYIGHMHIHSSVYGHIFILLLLFFIIIVYSLHY